MLFLLKKVNAEKTTEDGWTEFDESVPTRKHVLPSTDKVLPAGHTHLAVILHDATLEEVPGRLKTCTNYRYIPEILYQKNYIANNIKSNMKSIDEKKWVQETSTIEKGSGFIVSAGPYLGL